VLWLAFVALATVVSAQDLAPAAMRDVIYAALPSRPNVLASDFHAGMLSGDGTHVPLVYPGALTGQTQGTFTWEKRSPVVGILTVFSSTSVLRMEVTFTTSAKGTYREVSADGLTVRFGGDISFSAVPNDPTPPLLNVSSRVTLIAGQPTIIGFVVEGSTPRQVLVRAVGPSLAQFGVTNVAAAPALTVFKGAVQVAANAGWGGAPALAAAFASAGAFALPAASRDSAIVLTLDPGNYTAQVRDAAGGEVLLEVYLIK
jgi:hypothetical protein